jgi:hypothetical protein
MNPVNFELSAGMVGPAECSSVVIYMKVYRVHTTVMFFIVNICRDA